MSNVKLTLELSPDLAQKVLFMISGNQDSPVQQPTPPAVPAMAAPPVQQQVPVSTPVMNTAPTAAPPTYTIADLQKACAPLMDAGKQQDLVNLIGSFGVAAVTQIPQDRLGDFATALRGLGAQI